MESVLLVSPPMGVAVTASEYHRYWPLLPPQAESVIELAQVVLLKPSGV